ncbi:unnamed protein product, partial [Allacma fusca]
NKSPRRIARTGIRFVPVMSPAERGQLITLMCCCSADGSYPVVKYAKDHYIDILTLPPHSSHKLQPLDISFLGPLKSRYSSALTEWLASPENLKPVNEDVPATIRTSYDNPCLASIVINGFAKTGLWVPNLNGPSRYVFRAEEFAPEPEGFSDNSQLNQIGFNESDVPTDHLSLEQHGEEIYSEDEEQNIIDCNSFPKQCERSSVILNKVQSFKSLVQYASSSEDDEAVVSLYTHSTTSVNSAYLSSDNTAVVSTTPPNRQTEERTTQNHDDAVSPWNLSGTSSKYYFHDTSTRKKRAPELITSASNIAILKEKDRKSKTDSSSSEETRVTRSVASQSKRRRRSHQNSQ